MIKLWRYIRYLPVHWRTFVADFKYMLDNQRLCYHTFKDPEGVAMGRYDE